MRKFYAKLMLLMLLVIGPQSFALSLSGLESPIHVLPDSLEVRTVNGQADFTVFKEDGSYVASMVFEPSYREIFALYARNGVPTANIIKLPLDYSDVNFLFDQSLGLFFEKMTFSANPSQVSVVVRFNSNLDERAVRNLLLTNSIFGFVQAAVYCRDHEDEFYCGFPVPSLALKNQFRDQNLSAVQILQRRDYFALVDFKNRALLNGSNITSLNRLDEETKSILQLPSCVGLDVYHASICSTIKRYSISGLLSEAIETLIGLVFTGIDPMQSEQLIAGWFPSIAAFQDGGLTGDFLEDVCPRLSQTFGELIDNRLTPVPYSLWSVKERCSVLARGRYFIDLKFSDEISVQVHQKNWGVGIDAVFRVTTFGCQSKVFNIEGSILSSGYTLPPPPYFSCVGTGTDSTRCEYSPEENREFENECSRSANETFN